MSLGGEILWRLGWVLARPLWLGNFLSAAQEKFTSILSKTFISPPASTVLFTLFILFISTKSIELTSDEPFK